MELRDIPKNKPLALHINSVRLVESSALHRRCFPKQTAHNTHRSRNIAAYPKDNSRLFLGIPVFFSPLIGLFQAMVCDLCVLLHGWGVVESSLPNWVGQWIRIVLRIVDQVFLGLTVRRVKR